MINTEEHRYQIRTATTADVPLLAKMQMDLQKETLNNDSGLSRISNQRIARTQDYYRNQIENANSRLVVAYDMTIHKVVGMALGKIYCREGHVPEKSAEIIDVWSEPDHRGKALYTKLVAELVRSFKSNKVSSLTVCYAKEDLEAESLWYRLGFRPILVTAISRLDEVETALLMRPQTNSG